MFLKQLLKSIINTEHSLTSLFSPIAKEVVGIILIIPITIAGEFDFDSCANFINTEHSLTSLFYSQ